MQLGQHPSTTAGWGLRGEICTLFRGTAGPRRRRLWRPSVVVAAVKGSKKDAQVGFRYDAANLRWVRDDKAKWDPIVTPRTGGSYTVWPAVHIALVNYRLRSVSCAEAVKLAKKKYVLVDVRLESQFNKSHAKGAVNVPLFQEVQGSGFLDNAKKVLMGAAAMRATERNPNFIENAKEVIGKTRDIIVICNIGGTLDTVVKVESSGKVAEDKDRAFGRESRSLKACYELLEAGFKNVLHLDGGYQQWLYEELEIEGC